MKFSISLIFYFLLSTTYAFKLSPMTHTLELTEKKRSALFYVDNNSDKPQAIQITMTTRQMDEKGKETNKDIGDDFLIFPDQIILKPKEKKAVKVTYTGDDVLKEERAYRFIAEQMPLDFSKKKKGQTTNIKILLKYRAAFYVAPEGVKPDLKIVPSEIKVNKGRVSFDIENKGSAHKVLTRMGLRISEGKKSKELTTLKGVLGENILAHSKRHFSFRVPKDFSTSKKVKLELFEIKK